MAHAGTAFHLGRQTPGRRPPAPARLRRARLSHGNQMAGALFQWGFTSCGGGAGRNKLRPSRVATMKARRQRRRTSFRGRA